MRIWHISLLEYLPDLQFRSQLRELVAIMHSWRDTGKTNHILINPVMDYNKSDLVRYFNFYEFEYHKRYNKWLPKYWEEFKEFDDHLECTGFAGWHTKEYLRCNMANLYEKWRFAKGKSEITNKEWQRLLEGYEQITGEEYII